jgi:ankyrin repeat protein
MPDLSVDSEIIEAARSGDATKLDDLLGRYPDKIALRAEPYGATLLHLAASHVSSVDVLLRKGLDVNARESGDDTYAIHWAAAAGNLDAVRRLADAGGDVIGDGDDHQLGVIGWATCWDGCDDDAHRAVVDFLLSRGARHHIFSAIAMNLPDEVRRIVAANPGALNQRMSRNENNQLPLHFAVRKNRRDLVALLVELGADPLAADGSGFTAMAFAITPDVDRSVMTAINSMTLSEMRSAEGGKRAPVVTSTDLLAALSLGDMNLAQQVWDSGSPDHFRGVLHLMSKRGDVPAVEWLLEKGADPNTHWAHWDADVTPLHLAALAGHEGVARLLLANGADSEVRDSKHDSTATEWAEFFGHSDLVRLLKSQTPASD